MRRLALAAAIATGVQVGAAMVATRFVVHETGPATLALLRYVIGFACLAFPAYAALRTTKIARADLLPISLLGIGQFGILIALLNVGLRTVPSGRGALLFATFPLMTMLLAAALGRETLIWHRSTGVLLTIAGVALALGDKILTPGETGLASTSWTGELAVLAAALCGAICSILYRPYLRRSPAVAVSAIAMLASVAFLTILATTTESPLTTLPTITPTGWTAIAFIGIGSGAGYFLWLFALAHLSATEVTVALTLSPLTAIALGTLLLNEPATIGAWLGLATVATGMWLTTRDSAAKTSKVAPPAKG